jgi:hypothetical protein
LVEHGEAEVWRTAHADWMIGGDNRREGRIGGDFWWGVGVKRATTLGIRD